MVLTKFDLGLNMAAGFMGKAVRVQQRLLQRFPDDISLRNQMGVTFLLMNQPAAAKDVFKEVLEKWPEDGFAQVRESMQGEFFFLSFYFFICHH